jgi:hypothetical protein
MRDRNEPPEFVYASALGLYHVEQGLPKGSCR